MQCKPIVGVGVLIFNSKHEILLGKRIGSHGEFSWGPPGGHLDFGETIEICAIRETEEETGLKIQNPQFLAITNDLFKKEQKHYISIFMQARYIPEQMIENKEPHKIEEWLWFDTNNLPSPLFLPLQQLIEGKGYGEKI